MDQKGYRTFTIKREEDSTSRGILTTEQPVAMFDYSRGDFVPEVLLMSGMKTRGKSIKLLDSHMTDSVRNVLGSFDQITVRNAGERQVPYNFAEGNIRISETEATVAKKVEEGHINELSVGYSYSDGETVHVADGETKEVQGKEYAGPVNIRTTWMASEASLVPLGADDLAQLRGYKSIKDAREKISNQQTESTTEGMTPEGDDGNDTPQAKDEEGKQENKLNNSTTHLKMENPNNEVDAKEIKAKAIKAGAEEFDKRADAILAIGQEVDDAGWALARLREGDSVEEVQRSAIKKLKEATATLGTSPDPLGLSKKESKSYSMTDAMRALVAGKRVGGLEGEVSEAIAQRSGKETNGFFVASQRDLVAGTATDGDELVGTDLMGGDFIDALRPNMVTLQAGVRVLNGLKGDVSIPRKSSASAASFKTEVEASANSEPQFASVTMTPRHLGCYTDVSKQLLAQGTPDVDSLIRDDLNQAIAVGLDKAVLQGLGDGSNEPQGIINQDDVPVIVIADNLGGEPTTAELHDFIESLDNNNALTDNVSWITGAVIASAMKQTLLTTAISGYQWDMANKTVLGYNAYSTSNIPAERTILGDLSQYLLGIWDGVEIVYDPFSGAKNRLVTFVANIQCDGDVRQPLAFATSDNGA
tara:strand:+ start:5411 stop:7348 length:1938 start_codon:yes stop_codon:yes gene_type:complete